VTHPPEPNEVARFVSTGGLPTPDEVGALVTATYERHAGNRDGAPSDVYPALSGVAPDLFGLCVVSVNRGSREAGDAATRFTIMSVAKPFVFALVCDALGPEETRARVGVNATGLPFNSVAAVDRVADGRTNPMVNPGAIATTSLVAGESHDEQWETLRSGLSRFAGAELALDEEVYASASETNYRNRELVAALAERGAIAGDPAVGLDLYTRQSSLAVTARDLAAMGSTLAAGGVNPLTGTRVVSPSACRHTLAVMATAGLYETSGDWLYDVGLPGKSGIGGGIVTVSPGKGGLGTYAPRLDAAGNSVKGQLAARDLSRALGLDLFASEPP